MSPDTLTPLGKYMALELVGAKGMKKREAWVVRNKKSRHVLGWIEWYPSWKQYVFCPSTSIATVLNAECLKDIAGFLDQVNGVRDGS